MWALFLAELKTGMLLDINHCVCRPPEIAPRVVPRKSVDDIGVGEKSDDYYNVSPVKQDDIWIQQIGNTATYDITERSSETS